jgi:signal transduction histidine kinase
MPKINQAPDQPINSDLHLYQVCQEMVQDIPLDSLPERIVRSICTEVNASHGVICLMNLKGAVTHFALYGFSGTESANLREKLPVIFRKQFHDKSKSGASEITLEPEEDSLTGLPDAGPLMLFALSPDNVTGGFLLLMNQKDQPSFDDEQRLTAGILARFACVTLKNHILHKELALRDRTLTRRNENLALLDRLAATLATSTEISQILENGLAQLMDHLRLEIGEIYLRQEDSRNINLVVHRGNSGFKLWTRSQFTPGKGIVGEVVKGNKPILITPGMDEAPDLTPKVIETGIQQVVVVPMAGRRGVIGALCAANNHPQPLDEQEVQFLQAIGSWMATAIENVNLNLRGQRTAILEERDRIGMDLHDGIIQSIYAVGLTLEHARLLVGENSEQSGKRIEQSIVDLNSIIRDIRAYILDLRPRQLYNDDLMTGISRLVAEFKANTLMEVNMQGPAEDITGLANNQAVALFHICQEALANIAKHAHAHRADVVVWTTTERLLLEISDDGEGFDPRKTRVTIGHGLSNMETRIVNADGEVDISSEPGKGTTILAWVPLHSEDGEVDDYYE